MPKLNEKQKTQAEEGASDIPLLDPGVYGASLQKVEEKEGPKGPYWEWEFLVETDSEGNELEQTARIWENTSLSEKAIWRVQKMFDAFGVDSDTDTEDILGYYVALRVGQEVAAEGQRAGELQNCFLSASPIPE